MLETIKSLIGMTTDDKNFILQHYIKKAEGIIKGYCGISEIPEQYETAVIDYAIYLYKNRNEEGIQSVTQGSRAVSYTDSIPGSIRLALPKPKVKVGG